ncbi:MAG: glycosyltransferase family 4 protein [Rhodothermales bacterium]
MRIAYVCADPGVPVFGTKGCSIHVQEVIRAFVRQGHDVVLFAQRLGGGPAADLAGVQVWTLPSLASADTQAREKDALAANDRMLALLDREGPFDLVYERYSLWSHAGMTYASTHGIAGLLEVNAPLIEEQATHRVLIDRQGAQTVADHVFASASALIAVSDDVARYLVDTAVPAEKVHVVPNGVDPERFTPAVRPASPAPAGVFTVGFVGTLKPWHGLPDLIEGFALLRRADPTARLLIVGQGPEQDALEADLARRGLRDAAEFTGAVDPVDVPAYIASMDVAVAPYPKMDTCYFSPLKVFEYMASGRAVVGSRNGQLATLIEDGEDGLIYEPGDTAGLAVALIQLNRNSTLRYRLGENARRKILRHHTWEATADRIVHLGRSAQPILEEAA